MTTYDVPHIAELAHLPISTADLPKFTQAFTEAVAVIDKLVTADVANVPPTYQVTGLTNIWREDHIDHEHMFTQKEALANAPRTVDGYIAAPATLATDD